MGLDGSTATYVIFYTCIPRVGYVILTYEFAKHNTELVAVTVPNLV